MSLSTTSTKSNLPSEHHITAICSSLHSIIFIYWKREPAVYIVALATGIRLGAGFIWSAYTILFFSPLFENQSSGSSSTSDIKQSCRYSLYSVVSSDRSYVDSNSADRGISNSRYPYCVDGSCQSLSQTPWHNQVSDDANIVFSNQLTASLCVQYLQSGLWKASLFLILFAKHFIIRAGDASISIRGVYVLGTATRFCGRKYTGRIIV